MVTNILELGGGMAKLYQDGVSIIKRVKGDVYRFRSLDNGFEFRWRKIFYTSIVPIKAKLLAIDSLKSCTGLAILDAGNSFAINYFCWTANAIMFSEL